MSEVKDIQDAERVALNKLCVLIELTGSELGQETRQQLYEEAQNFIAAVPHEKLLKDEAILRSLRIAINQIRIDIMVTEDWTVSLVKQLSQIFPTKVVNALALRTMGYVTMANRYNLPIDLTPMERETHIAERMDKLTPKVEQRLRPIMLSTGSSYRGTQTELTPCPECGLEKRCDAKTKNFRCKCGFASAYPFPSIAQ